MQITSSLPLCEKVVLIAALILSTLMVLLLHGSWSSSGRLTILAVSAVLALTTCQSLVLLLQAAFTGLAILSTVGQEISSKQLLGRLLVATGLAYALAGIPGFIEVRDTIALQQQQPLESMADRLAYEPPPQSNPAISLAALEDYERRLPPPNRNEIQQLERIHGSLVDRFINSPGFGVGRFLGESASTTFSTVGESIDRASAPSILSGPSAPTRTDDVPIHLPHATPADYQAVPTTPGESLGEVVGQLALPELHGGAVIDFVHSSGFGYLPGQRMAAGFQPHHFSRLPAVQQPWIARNVQLVSLLKHERPVAYVSANLPRMKELGAVPTRLLTAWEQDMLGELRQGADLQIMAGSGRIYMLGSVRAARQCLGCHQAERGQLLGAFTYVLQQQ